MNNTLCFKCISDELYDLRGEHRKMKSIKKLYIINDIFDVVFIITAILIGLNVFEMNDLSAILFVFWSGFKIVSLISKKVYKQRQ